MYEYLTQLDVGIWGIAISGALCCAWLGWQQWKGEL